jgi:flagellar hook assembly protein FlgD
MHVKFHARSTRFLATTALAFAAFTACNKEQKVAGGDVTPGAAATTPAASTVAIADVDVGKAVSNARVTDKTNDFKPADTVYTSVHTTGSASAATVMARWTFQDGQVVQESSQSIAPSGDAYTEFHISKPSGLPKGKYKVEVFLDSKSAGTKDFEVK